MTRRPLKLPRGIPQPTWCDEEFGVALYRGDCREILPRLPVVSAVVTDPPYGIGINKSQRLSVSRGFGGEDWDAEPADMTWFDPSGIPAIIWGGNYFDLPPTRCPLVWDKDNAGRDFADFEMAWTNLDKVARRMIHRPMNMDGGKVHPTQKPVRVMEWCIKELPLSCSTILDPFMGSGSTGVACVNQSRSFIGVELEPTYFDIAVDRISNAILEKQDGPLFATHQPAQLEISEEKK